MSLTRAASPIVAILSAALIAGCKSAEPSAAPSAPSAAAVTPGPSAPSAPATSAPESAAKSAGLQARRIVKTATDPDAGKIDKTPKPTTIEDIVAQKAPGGAPLGTRSAPFETTTWQVPCTLKSVQLMKDGDYYLVMQGKSGAETVVEVPDPAQCQASPLEPEIAAARKQLETRYHPTKDIQQINDPATVSGVGFLGWAASTKGATVTKGAKGAQGAKGRTGPRLMPGTGFEFAK